jgi:hypothetical protein
MEYSQLLSINRFRLICDLMFTNPTHIIILLTKKLLLQPYKTLFLIDQKKTLFKKKNELSHNSIFC